MGCGTWRLKPQGNRAVRFDGRPRGRRPTRPPGDGEATARRANAQTPIAPCSPKLLPYLTWPHVGGKIRWFDPAPPTESWRGKQQYDEIGLHKGFWHLFRTRDGVWICCFGFDEYQPSIRRATGQEIHHYQVLPGGANRWFAKNNQSPPEILFRDLEAAKASSEQDPFVLRAPNGVLFAYGNLDAAKKIDVDAMAGDPVAEAGRVIAVTNFGLLARYTYELEKIRKRFNAPDGEWGDYPEKVNLVLAEINVGIMLADGLKELNHYLNTELGENVNTEALVEVKRRISKRHKIDFDEISRLPIAEVVRLLKPETAGPIATPRGDQKPAAAPAAGTDTRVDPIELTTQMLGKAVAQIKLVHFLRARDGEQASLTDIDKNLFGRQTARKNNLRTVSRLAEKTRRNLDDKGCPLRLHISGNVVRLIGAKPAA